MTRPPAPLLTPAEQNRADAFEAAPVLAEAFDGAAACLRVLELAAAYERGDIGDPGRAVVAWMMRVAVYDSVPVPEEATDGVR